MPQDILITAPNLERASKPSSSRVVRGRAKPSSSRQPGRGQPHGPRFARCRDDPALRRRASRRRARGERARRDRARHRRHVAARRPRGYGQAIGVEAMALGIERARRHGAVSWRLAQLAPPRAHRPLGRAVPGAGLVSLHFVNVVSRPIVAPWGGRDARFGTNPVCIGIPRAGQRAVRARLRDQPHRPGQDTRRAQPAASRSRPARSSTTAASPTTTPRYTVIPPFGAILPFGEHKGYGLAVAAELLGGALAACDGRTLPTKASGAS